jgi:hypothetical protein
MKAHCFAALLSALCLLALSPARAQEDGETTQIPPQPAQISAGQFLLLAETYQSSYFQVVAIACFQLYSSTGIIATDFDNGFIDAQTALNALDQSTLLHSVCSTTLLDIGELTPEGDRSAHEQIEGLLAVLSAEGLLISSLGDHIAAPGEENARLVSEAQLLLEQELERYMAGEAAAPGS